MIKLRDLRPEDQDQVLRWRNLPDVRRWMYTDHVIGPEEHAAWFRDALTNPSKKYWVITWQQCDVGLANLGQIDYGNRRCTWGLYIADAQTRGHGIGASAASFMLDYVFSELALERLWCEVLSTNVTAIAAYRSLGMKREGLLRRHVTKSDGSHDVVVMGILREEWVKE